MEREALLQLLQRAKSLSTFANNLTLEIENFKALHRMNLGEQADAKRTELILMFESYLDTLVELEREVREIK